jgi:hypothetical protein
MCLFKKKKIYKLTWQFDTPSQYSYTELIKAYDQAHAWAIVKRAHSTAISLVSIEEIK